MISSLFAVYALVLGACIASFLCVVAERVPAGVSINGRSRCACGRQLRAWENVPLVGWLSCRGRARCCGARLPVRYVLAEAGLGSMWAVLGAWVGQAAGPGVAAEPALGTRVAIAGALAVSGALLLLVVIWDRRAQSE